ncbi:aprataxin-like protein [Pseudogymnoascus verrucosus]|uniref:Aprataxin-like protein n=1 Tax=Pseudogymnoascus verrucosus TaxID=342668 RepID=A0A1B8G8A6_9PEZI|nr:aprataxin-like protein [Pseudogymnoascus verrucosus]OBT92063.1 aprataxin-like protein [Pseudogymnoascus verrucosus]
MASPTEETQDAITEEEIQGTIVPPASSTSIHPNRNAFTELMRHKSRKTTIVPSSSPHEKPIVFEGRRGLGAYTYNPAAFPPSDVIFYNDTAVAVNDLYPKSSVHTLLLPRSERNLLHPVDAFEDAAFLAATVAESEKLRKLVAKELRRRYGKVSKLDQERERVLNGEVELADGEELPKGRDWESEVMMGIHAHPSMSHLHVHVLSVDRYSECMKNRAHYNSFTTPFFVPLDAFPLAADDPRRDPSEAGYLSQDLKCWRCGAGFGRSFARLNEHLAVEFEAWKKI